MKWWMVVIPVAVVVVIAVFVVRLFTSGEPVEAAKAEFGEIRQFVDERGKTRLPSVHLITMPFGGRIEEITLVEGDPVKKDQIVARIVPSDLADAVDEARAVVARLDAAIAEKRDVTVESTTKKQADQFVDSMVHTLAAAKNRMTSGEAKMAYALKNLHRIQKLFEDGATSQDELDRAELAAVEGQVGYRQDELVWRATGSIKAASDLLPTMITQYIDRKGLGRAVLEKQKVEAVARLRQIETQQRRGTMRSPIAGVVLERLVSNERNLPAGTTLLRIGNLDNLEVEADILSQDVLDVKPRQAVEIYGPAIGKFRGGKAGGFVKRIHPAGFTKISSLGVEQQRVKVVIGFAPGVLEALRKTRDLGVDYRVRVRIFTAEEKKALLVPRSALFRAADGGWQVFAVRGRRAALTPVRVGLMNDRQVQITKGLARGDTVILAPETSLTDGVRVKPILRSRSPLPPGEG